MGQFLQVAEAEETAGSLDGVDGAEDAGERVPVVRVLFQHHELGVELIQALQAFGQELFDDVIHSWRCSDSYPVFRELGD